MAPSGSKVSFTEKKKKILFYILATDLKGECEGLEPFLRPLAPAR